MKRGIITVTQSEEQELLGLAQDSPRLQQLYARLTSAAAAQVAPTDAPATSRIEINQEEVEALLDMLPPANQSNLRKTLAECLC